MFNCKSKKSRFWFSCSFFLRSLQGTCPNNCSCAAGTPGAAGEGFRTIVPASRSGSQAKLRSFQAAGLLFPNNCSRRRLSSQVDPDNAAGSRDNLLPFRTIVRSPLLEKPDPDPIQGGDLPEAEQFSRLRPNPAPITPIPLRVRTILRSPCLHPV